MINCDRSKVKVPTIKRDYKTPEIYKKLGEISYNKCYLCETKKDNPENFHIEHFIPHGNVDKLKYDWNNLLLACGDTCNFYKGTKIDLLNPCNPEQDVEKLITYDLTPIDYEPRFYPSTPENTLITNTCDLLNKIHNGDNHKSNIKTASLRNAIKRRAIELLTATKNYYKADKEKVNIDIQINKDIIQRIVSRTSPYTMLMRSIAVKDGLSNLFD